MPLDKQILNYVKPVNISAPVVSGALVSNGVITSTAGSWDQSTTDAPTGYSFQWNIDGSPIPGAIASSTSGSATSIYTLLPTDLAHSITCTVTATNAYGSTTSTSGISIGVQVGITLIPPTDCGWTNVVTAGVDNTGLTDVTAKLQTLINQALDKAQNFRPAVLYFPNGTYLISNTLYCKNSAGTYIDYLTFRGENKSLSILKMQDHVWNVTASTTLDSQGYVAAPTGFSRSDRTEQAMVYWSTYGDVQGNNAICNFAFDMTFDLGNNPSGCAASFLANNVAALRRCIFKCTAGFIGAELGRGQTGPAMVADCDWIGPWTMPMTTNGGEYSVMMERCTIAHSPAGYSVYANIIMGIKDCTFVDPLCVIGGGDITFWYSDGWTGAHNTTYTYGPNSRIQTVGPGIAGYKIHSVDTPSPNYDPISQWANVNSYSSVQAALNSGKSTIYWPLGTSTSPGSLPQGLTVPATVNRIMFMGYGPTMSYGGNTSTPFFTTTGTSSTPLIFDSCSNQNGSGVSQTSSANIDNANNYTFIKHQANRDLVVIDWAGCGKVVGTGVGRIFFEDCTLPISIGVGDQFYARQWNWEDPFVIGLSNAGGQAWVMGPKTEFGCPGSVFNNNFSLCYSLFQPTIMATGGRTETFAGFGLPNSGVGSGFCEFVMVNSSFALSYANVQTVAVYWPINNGLSASPSVTASVAEQPNNFTFYCAASYSYNGG